MPQFSQNSIDKLNTCHPDLIVLFRWVIRFYDCTIVCGYRTRSEQERAFNEGKSTLHYPGKHNAKPSYACDAAPYEKTGIDWSLKQSAHFAGAVQMIAKMLLYEGKITHEIIAGADWDGDMDIDDTKFWDACHFEVVPLPGEIMKFYPY